MIIILVYVPLSWLHGFEKISGVSFIVVPVMTTLFLCTAGVALELQLHLLDSASYLACGDFSITAPGPPLL